MTKLDDILADEQSTYAGRTGVPGMLLIGVAIGAALWIGIGLALWWLL